MTPDSRSRTTAAALSIAIGLFIGLLLGSVSHQCAHHPPCPVVILPPPDGSDRAAAD